EPTRRGLKGGADETADENAPWGLRRTRFELGRRRGAPSKSEAPQALNVSRAMRRGHRCALRAEPPLPPVSRDADPSLSAPEARGVRDDDHDHVVDHDNDLTR